jgi:HK97 family phage portal protein
MMNFLQRLKRSWQLTSTDPEFLQLMGAQTAISGVVVTEKTALTLTTVYSCIDLLSSTIASLPLHVYRRTSNGKERAIDHPLYGLLHDKVNPRMTSFAWRNAAVSHLLGWGNSYSEIQLDGAGRTVALWLFRPDKMQVWQNEDLTLTYIYSLPNGSTVRLPDYRVLHLRGLSFDGIMGYSPIDKARETLGLALATLQYGAAFFANNANPSVALTLPGTTGNAERAKKIAEAWDATHAGLTNAHRTAVLEGGADIKVIGIPPENAQFLETRKFTREEIASIYRVPAHLIGDLEHATFSNVENLDIQFEKHTVRSWAVNIEQELSGLFQDADRQTYFAEFALDGLLRGDTASRHAAYALGRQWGYYSVNDIRGMENMNGIGSAGDRYLEPLNMTVPPNIRSLLLPVVADVMEGIRKKEAQDVLSEGRKCFVESGVAGFTQWVINYMAAPFLGLVTERLAAPMLAHIRAVGEGKPVDESIGKAFAAVQSRRYVESEQAALLSVVSRAQDTFAEPMRALEVFYAERAQNSSASLASDILGAVNAQLEVCNG